VAEPVRLRPVERRIRRLVEEDVPLSEIAARFRRSPDLVRRIVEWSELPGRETPAASTEQLRPVERRILRWRDEGASHADIAPRFHRSAGFVRQVEELARYKLAR
jgi:DNA-binding CsgD family transcriptional regulator